MSELVSTVTTEYVLIAHRTDGSYNVLTVHEDFEDARRTAIKAMHPIVSVPTGEWNVVRTAHAYRKVTIHKSLRRSTPIRAASEAARAEDGGETT